ncbi:MAG: hypothetical protein AAFY49_06650, partial [Pseudomonadota bacterium]
MSRRPLVVISIAIAVIIPTVVAVVSIIVAVVSIIVPVIVSFIRCSWPPVVIPILIVRRTS